MWQRTEKEGYEQRREKKTKRPGAPQQQDSEVITPHFFYDDTYTSEHGTLSLPGAPPKDE